MPSQQTLPSHPDHRDGDISDHFTFDGFEPANTTPVPDILFDLLLPHLNEAQLKTLLYIVRRTLGFKKSTDAISLNQFRHGITTKDGKQLDTGCGLKNMTSISKALTELEKMHCIESTKTTTEAGDKATTVYRIHFRGTTANVVPTTANVVPHTPPVAGTTPNVVGVLRQTYDPTTANVVGVLRQTYPQETVIQETVIQETVIQHTDSARVPAETPQRVFSLPAFPTEPPPRRKTNGRSNGHHTVAALPPLTLAGQHRLEQYEQFIGNEQVPTEKLINAANGLGGKSDEEFLLVATEIRDNDFLNERDIARDLPWIHDHYDRYLGIARQKRTKKHRPPTTVPTLTAQDEAAIHEKNRQGLARFQAHVAATTTTSKGDSLNGHHHSS